jgi:hypothetical protein
MSLAYVEKECGMEMQHPNRDDILGVLSEQRKDLRDEITPRSKKLCT